MTKFFLQLSKRFIIFADKEKNNLKTYCTI